MRGPQRPDGLTLPVAATLLLFDELLCDVALYLVTLFIVFVIVVLDDVGRCVLVLLASPRIGPCDN